MTTITANTTAGLIIDADTSGALTFVTGGSNVAMQINPAGTIDLSSSRLILPVGNTAVRANVIGALRFNNESNVFETYNGNAWTDVSVAPPVLVNVDYLVVGGGGGGGAGVGGGGGAGGFRTDTDLSVSAGTT